jgi:hypothetical protein
MINKAWITRVLQSPDVASSTTASYTFTCGASRRGSLSGISPGRRARRMHEC